MLDSRTSLPAGKAVRAAVPAKNAGLLAALSARPSQQNDLSFGSVLSNTLSDRRVAPASPDRTAVGQASSPAEPAQKSRKESAARERDAEDGTKDAAAQSASQGADLQGSTPPEPQAGQVGAPESRESGRTDESLASVDGVSGPVQQGAAVGLANGTASAGDAGVNPSSSAKSVLPGLTPLQWMAQQQMARLNAQTEQVRAALPVQSVDANVDIPSPNAASTVVNAQAALEAVPVARPVLAEQMSSAGSALDVLKTPLDEAGNPPSKEPAAATHGSVSQTQSMTADPVGLLNPSEGPTYTAMSMSHVSPPPAAAPPSAMQPPVAQSVMADENAIENMQRLAAIVHAKVGQGQSVARMQLQPPELGAVTAVVQLQQGKMDLRLEVANEAARDLVTDGLGRLRDSLQQQGITLDRATVNVSPRSDNAGNDQQQPTWNGSQDQPSGEFHSGQGQRQDEPSFTASFAMDVPAGAGEVAGDVPTGAVYVAGLNVLA